MTENSAEATNLFAGFIKAVQRFPRREFKMLVLNLDWRGSPFECVGIAARYVSLWFRVNCIRPIVVEAPPTSDDMNPRP